MQYEVMVFILLWVFLTSLSLLENLECADYNER